MIDLDTQIPPVSRTRRRPNTTNPNPTPISRRQHITNTQLISPHPATARHIPEPMPRSRLQSRRPALAHNLDLKQIPIMIHKNRRNQPAMHPPHIISSPCRQSRCNAARQTHNCQNNCKQAQHPTVHARFTRRRSHSAESDSHPHQDATSQRDQLLHPPDRFTTGNGHNTIPRTPPNLRWDRRPSSRTPRPHSSNATYSRSRPDPSTSPPCPEHHLDGALPSNETVNLTMFKQAGLAPVGLKLAPAGLPDRDLAQHKSAVLVDVLDESVAHDSRWVADGECLTGLHRNRFRGP